MVDFFCGVEQPGSSSGSIANPGNMNTKLKGDIAEQAAIVRALKLGWGVAKPIGDRMPYDLIFDVEGKLVRIQVKCAWLDAKSQNYIVDIRRTKTNRRIMIRDLYQAKDFDFALVFMPELDIYYIFPVNVFIGFKSSISMVEAAKRQRKPQSASFREAWDIILHWAAREGNLRVNSVKFGEASSGGNPEPSLKFSEKI